MHIDDHLFLLSMLTYLPISFTALERQKSPSYSLTLSRGSSLEIINIWCLDNVYKILTNELMRDLFGLN